MDADKLFGIVTIFDARKGWGFCRGENGGDNYFIHYSNIISPHKFKVLHPGQRVRFIPQEGKKGPAAVEVEAFETLTEQLANKF